MMRKQEGKMAENNWEKVEEGFWVPEEKGDEISGVYLGFKEDIGQNKSRLYSIENEEGKMNVWGSKVLDGKMMIIKIGQQVKIVFLGRVKSEGKKEYKGYDVFTKSEDFNSLR
jgi:hypothetical protein